jgi:hypothetical protein
VGEDAVEPEPPPAPTSEPEAAPGPALLCEDHTVEELGLGESIESSIDDPVWTRCFWVEIPEGLSSATFELSGVSADLTLGVGYGFVVTLQYNIAEFWRSGEAELSDEIVVIENPAPGPYFLAVGPGGLRTQAQFTLGVRTEPEMTSPPTGAAFPAPGTCAGPAAELTVGGSVDAELAASDRDPLPRRYFCVLVPEGLSSLTIALSGLESDLDLFVRRTRPGEWTDRSRGGEGRTVVIENPPGGTYFIDVAPAYRGAGSAFTLSVSGP